MARRLLLVHAHPDDESSQSVATMAHYLAQGDQVTLVTCTLGELGEIMLPQWQHYSPAELGQHRLEEVNEALTAVGITDHIFLGGVGRYHDTGMAHGPTGLAVVPDEVPDNAFWQADLLEAANHLVEVIRSRRPQVVSTYDPFGNYGHPDHIQAHRVTMYAVQLAAVATYRPDLGQPWQVSRVLWSTHNTAVWREAYEIAKQRGLKLWDEEPSEERFGADPSQIAAIIPTAPWLDVMRRALDAHRSQVDLDSPFWQFYWIMQEQSGAGEAYLLATGHPFPASASPADDLFAGLALD